MKKILPSKKMDVWQGRLSLALKIEGALFSMFWILAYTMKFGMVWHDAGPPFGETHFSCYFNMILSVYFVLGLYLLQISYDPSEHKSMIGFLIWSSVAHLVTLVACVAFDDTPSYAGPTIMGVDLPARVMGVAHWQNISPIGDVPLLAFFTGLDMYLAFKTFGSFLLPFDLKLSSSATLL